MIQAQKLIEDLQKVKNKEKDTQRIIEKLRKNQYTQEELVRDLSYAKLGQLAHRLFQGEYT